MVSSRSSSLLSALALSCLVATVTARTDIGAHVGRDLLTTSSGPQCQRNGQCSNSGLDQCVANRCVDGQCKIVDRGTDEGCHLDSGITSTCDGDGGCSLPQVPSGCHDDAVTNVEGTCKRLEACGQDWRFCCETEEQYESKCQNDGFGCIANQCTRCGIEWGPACPGIGTATASCLTADLAVASDGSCQRCGEEGKPSCANVCGKLYEDYGIMAGYSWGSAGSKSDVQQEWKSENCDVKICDYWAAKHHIIPHKSWGSMPDAAKASWDWDRSRNGSGTGDCNENLTEDSS